MALLPASLAIKPGVDTQSTPLQTGAGIQTSQLIRHKNGLIQKLGGCTHLASSLFSGVCNHVLPWSSLNGTKYVGLGTTAQLAVLDAGVVNDITPGAGIGSGNWDLDKWGQDLLASVEQGTIYQWIPPVSGGNIALPILNAPSAVTGIFVAAPQQQVIAFGAYSVSLGAQDPLLVAWNDVANLTVWTATATNQAGTFRLPNGSKIVGGYWTGLSGLLWTDLDLWAMTYANFPLIYGFNRLSQNCGLIARHAVGLLGTRFVWMSQNDFFIYQGSQVAPLKCAVWDFIFDNLDRNYIDNIHCDTNSYGFDEAMWRFPMTGSGGVCNGYVKWTPDGPDGGLWDYGEGEPKISAWYDQSVVGAPIGTDYNGLIQQFETSNDFDGVVLTSSLQTGWFTLVEGEQFIYLERILPDFTLNTGGEIKITVDFADYVSDLDTDYPIRSYGPYTVTQSTPYVIIEGRGRVFRLTLTSDVADTFWRYGKPLAVMSPDGTM